jgi:hypothetical protein
MLSVVLNTGPVRRVDPKDWRFSVVQDVRIHMMYVHTFIPASQFTGQQATDRRIAQYRHTYIRIYVHTYVRTKVSSRSPSVW